MSEFKLPTETVELPSKGLLYDKSSPLATGKIEMKYMTAKEEDILTNTNYLANGTAIDKLLQSLIVTPNVNYGDLLLGDKNGIMIAARILAYGKDYSFEYNGEEVTVDLSTLDSKPFREDLIVDGKNEFSFKLPHSGNEVTFKLLTHSDERKIDNEVNGLKKINKNASPEGTTRLKHLITSVNGNREQADIRRFVDEFLLARDARELRKYYGEVAPDIDLKTQIGDLDDGQEDVDIPITVRFFWPDAGL